MNMVVHPQQVQMAHQYGCAAGKQGKFIEYKDGFWKNSYEEYKNKRDMSQLGPEAILKWAPQVGLDATKLKADGESDACKQRVEEDMQELGKFHVGGTPGFFINGKFIGGGIPEQAFHQIIDEKLKIAEASGVPGSSYYEKEIMGKGVHEFQSKKRAEKPTQQ